MVYKLFSKTGLVNKEQQHRAHLPSTTPRNRMPLLCPSVMPTLKVPQIIQKSTIAALSSDPAALKGVILNTIICFLYKT